MLKISIVFLGVILFQACSHTVDIRTDVARKEKPLVKVPIVIGHRGASGYRPEHTLSSYALAIDQGADFLEPDFVSTKDGVLIARHENEISQTTDVAQRFPGRKTKKQIEGVWVEGWFTEDFTLKEIKTLRAKERLSFRDHSYDGKFEILTMDEVLDFVTEQSKLKGRMIGVYPEVKHPGYFRSLGLPLEEKLVKALHQKGWKSKDSPVFIQSFDQESIKRLRNLTQLRLVLLLGVEGFSGAWSDLAREVDAVGPDKKLLLPWGSDRRVLAPTDFVMKAHEVGLLVHPWTFRRESEFLPKDFENRFEDELREYFRLGVDGVFSDFPDVAIRVREGSKRP